MRAHVEDEHTAHCGRRWGMMMRCAVLCADAALRFLAWRGEAGRGEGAEAAQGRAWGPRGGGVLTEKRKELFLPALCPRAGGRGGGGRGPGCARRRAAPPLPPAGAAASEREGPLDTFGNMSLGPLRRLGLYRRAHGCPPGAPTGVEPLPAALHKRGLGGAGSALLARFFHVAFPVEACV